MKPGESTLLPVMLKGKGGTLSTAGKANGCRYIWRTEGVGTRIYCTEPKPAKTNGAARVQQINTTQQAWA